MKNCPGDKFSIGDSVLVKNPAITGSKGMTASRDPFAPINVVAEVMEPLSGGRPMYKLKLPDGEDFYQKDVFEGEIVLFRQNEANAVSSSNEKSSVAKDRKMVLDAISDFALQVRRSACKAKDRRLNKTFQHSDINSLFMQYFDILDCGVLAELYGEQDSTVQQEMHAAHTKGMSDLKQIGFPFFYMALLLGNKKKKFGYLTNS